MGGGLRGPRAAVVITLPGNMMIVRVRIPGVIGCVIVARAAHVVIVRVDVVRGHHRTFRAASDNPDADQRAGQHQTNSAGTFQGGSNADGRHPIIDAAMMMHTPRMTAAPTIAAATFLFSTISLCRLPGVQKSKIL